MSGGKHLPAMRVTALKQKNCSPDITSAAAYVLQLVPDRKRIKRPSMNQACAKDLQW